MATEEPATGRTVPTMIVPRDPATAEIVNHAANAWWHGLTPEERSGLWVRYAPPV